MAESSYQRGSRRQKIFDLMKTTRDVYIPTIANTVTQLASEATTKALNYTDSEGVVPNTDTQGAEIILYPHFTRRSSDGDQYFTQVNGWVYSTTGSQRKKKIIMSLARQLIKSNNNAVSDVTAGQLDEQISSIQDDDKSFYSTNSDPSLPSSPIKRTGTASSAISDTGSFSSSLRSNDADEILKERIAAFLNRSLGNLELTVAVGGENRDDINVSQILTDSNGNFDLDIKTPFRPSYVQVAVYLDERIFQFKETIFPGDSEYAVISDIDDTIKKTGVLDDKRTVFRTTFANDISSWEVPGAADCYRYFQEKHGFSFFYVSNSPYQLYSSLSDFFNVMGFPTGSIYLKKYSGNILNSILEPSHTRKKAPLQRIFKHFSSKKFFLIGDSSEQDLEAYVDIAKASPENVAGIFIRVVNGSMSTETFKSLVSILNKHNIPTDITDQKDITKLASENLIDLESDEDTTDMAKIDENSKIISDKITHNLMELEGDSTDDFFAETETKVDSTPTPRAPSYKKPFPPPKIPKKPTYLKTIQSKPTSASSERSLPPSNSESSTSDLSSAPPSLPRRPIPPPPPPRRRNLQINSPETQTSTNMTFTDESNDEWISRILTSLIILRKLGDIKLRLFVDFSEVQQEIENIVTKK